MSSYRKLAAGSLAFAVLGVMLTALSLTFVERLPASLHGTLTDWICMGLVGVFAIGTALYCLLAYGFAFRVADDPSLLGDASGVRVIKRLTGFYVPGGQQTDFLLISRLGGLWLAPAAPQPRGPGLKS